MTAINDNIRPTTAALGANLCVTVSIGAQRLAIPIARVEDIFAVQSVTPVPLAPSYIAGLINLRGKVVTGMDVVDKIRAVPTGNKGMHQNVPLEPVTINKATLEK